MNTLQVLITGDYWHEDFREQFSSLAVPATMVPLERIQTTSGRNFDVVVLAQSRRDQFSQLTVDAIRHDRPETPIVLLMGSWCEGENRSGEPLDGVNQVPWHQWQARFQNFCDQLSEGREADWHLPLTATVADKAREFSPDPLSIEKMHGRNVLICCEDRTTFETIADMLKIYQCASYWFEADEFDIDADVICVDGNGASEAFVGRVRMLKEKFAEAPLVALLNFPRTQDFALLATEGIQEVVSKPYTHQEFLHAVVGVLGNAQKEHSVPQPKIALQTKVQGEKHG